ncbi:MAG TPA: lysophospholipid acyltransferase family protein [Candidatus Limiplasma sp.]|nr:lysophospholipid acyltransferase family protein [Candidatus Limiplasma sp.]
MTQTQTKPQRKSHWYSFVVVLATIVFHTIMPVKYCHREYTKLDAPYILIGNHTSMLDPVIIACGIRKLQVRFMGKAELTKNPLLRFFFKHLRMIPVNRFNTDMKAMRSSLKVLKDGHVLGIFPEGTRYKQGIMEDMEGGTAMIALQSGVPILPAYIQGKVRPFHRIRCIYGEPFTISDLKAKGVNKETAAEVLQRISEIYRKMVQENAQASK